MKTEVKSFSVPWTKNDYHIIILNGVLESVLVRAQLSSKLAHGSKQLTFRCSKNKKNKK